MSIQFVLQGFFSIQHIRTAAYMARRAKRLEARYDGSATSRLLPAIRANSTSALFAAVEFLEAIVNELFADAGLPDGGHLKGFDATILRQIAEASDADVVQRTGTMEKFDRLLSLAGQSKIARGEAPGQDVALMIRLRNGLIHYKAPWLDAGSPELVRSGSLAKSGWSNAIARRFPLRARSGSISTDGWIGYGCAQWAVKTSLAYTDLICSRLSITPIYEHVRREIQTE